MPVTLELEVSRTYLRAGGVDQPERLARLKWLNSTAGLDDRITTPYTPLRLAGKTVACLGREVRFGAGGFPDSVKAGAVEVLAAPVNLRVYQSGAPVQWQAAGKVVSSAPSKIVLDSESSGSGFRLHVETTMEFDGGMGFDVRLKSDKDAQVSDIALELPFREAAVPYIAGMGAERRQPPKGLAVEVDRSTAALDRARQQPGVFCLARRRYRRAVLPLESAA